MAEQSTFIKLDRNIIRWRWFKSRTTLQVFIWLLLNANVADHEFEHEIIHRGQIATSYKTIENATAMTSQQVRNAIYHLKQTGEITSRSTNRYQVISIVNYDLYQGKTTGKIADKIAVKEQANNRQTTGKEQQYKNIKNKRSKEYNPPKSPQRGESPSVGQQWDNLHAETMMPRDMGTYDDIPLVYRDGTYQSFRTWEEYWDWSNQ